MEQGRRGPARREGEPGTVGHDMGEEVKGIFLVEVARGEARDREVRQERLDVGGIAVDREVERNRRDPGQLGDLVLEHAAVAGVDEVERRRPGEVLRVEPEPRHADVGADEDPVPRDQHHVGVRVGAIDDPDVTRVDSLGTQAGQHGVAGTVGADRPEVRRLGAGPGRGHGDVQGVAAREHPAEVVVPVDDVVAGAEELHLSIRP